MVRGGNLFAALATFVILTLAAMATPTVNPALWTTTPSGKNRSKGQAQNRGGGGGGKSPANRQGGGDKGKKRSQSGPRNQPVGAPAGDQEKAGTILATRRNQDSL